jgi:hypothetical protein
MITGEIKVHDTATPRLRELYDRVAPGRRGPLVRRLGKALEATLQEHFRRRNLASDAESKRAQKGFPQSGLWARIRRSTALTSANDSQATISIGEPAMRTKLFGARITPGPGKRFLAIPLRAIVYGKPPRGNPVPGMFVAWVRGKAYIAARDGDRLTVLYRLVRSVRVPRDPQALPDPAQYREKLERIAIQEVLRK